MDFNNTLDHCERAARGLAPKFGKEAQYEGRQIRQATPPKKGGVFAGCDNKLSALSRLYDNNKSINAIVKEGIDRDKIKHPAQQRRPNHGQFVLDFIFG